MKCCDYVTNLSKILWKIDDKMLLELNGSDYTLYLIFIKHSIGVFLALTAFALVFLYPIYASGDPDGGTPDQFQDKMNKLTIGNVSANDGKMVFAYFCAVFIIPIWAAVALWFYRKTKALNLDQH